MRTSIRLGLTLALVAGSSFALADGIAKKPPKDQRNFLACPINMDTKDVPCWVAEYEGERYYLTVQTGRTEGADVYPFSPMIGHKVLVEGTVSDEPRICGGIVLREVRLSPQEEVVADCGKMIPGEGYQTRGFRPLGPDARPPSWHAPSTAIPMNEEGTVLISRKQRDATYAKVLEARKSQTYTIPYFFNSLYIPYPVEQRVVDDAAKYAVDVKASRIEITGYRGATILSNGERLLEKPEMGRIRAEGMADIFEFFNVPRERMVVTWKEEPEDQGGLKDYQKRRVVLSIIP